MRLYFVGKPKVVLDDFAPRPVDFDHAELFTDLIPARARAGLSGLRLYQLNFPDGYELPTEPIEVFKKCGSVLAIDVRVVVPEKTHREDRGPIAVGIFSGRLVRVMRGNRVYHQVVNLAGEPEIFAYEGDEPSTDFMKELERRYSSLTRQTIVAEGVLASSEDEGDTMLGNAGLSSVLSDLIGRRVKITVEDLGLGTTGQT